MILGLAGNTHVELDRPEDRSLWSSTTELSMGVADRCNPMQTVVRY